MRIRTLWHKDDDVGMPWLVTAIDEYTEEEHHGLPIDYQRAKDTMPGYRRELIIYIPEAEVVKLFKVPTIDAKTET